MNLQDAQRMVRNLISRPDLDAMAANSFLNFHAPGLDYLNLLRTNNLTIKAYIGNTHTLEHNPYGYLVSPHTHGYNFHSFVLHGEMENVRFYAAHPEGEPWHEWAYKSPLKGGSGGLTLHAKTTLKETSDLYTAGTGYYLSTTEIHTIRFVQPDSVLLLFQYQDHDDIAHTRMFTKSKDQPDCSKGLYAKTTAKDCDRMIEMIERYI